MFPALSDKSIDKETVYDVYREPLKCLEWFKKFNAKVQADILGTIYLAYINSKKDWSKEDFTLITTFINFMTGPTTLEECEPVKIAWEERYPECDLINMRVKVNYFAETDTGESSHPEIIRQLAALEQSSRAVQPATQGLTFGLEKTNRESFKESEEPYSTGTPHVYGPR